MTVPWFLGKGPQHTQEEQPVTDALLRNLSDMERDAFALRAENAALRLDKERLDWLERETASLHCNFCSPNNWTITHDDWDGSDGRTAHGDTLRAAIDAAMTAPQQAEQGGENVG